MDYFAERGKVYARTPDGIREAATALTAGGSDLEAHQAAVEVAAAQESLRAAESRRGREEGSEDMTAVSDRQGPGEGLGGARAPMVELRPELPPLPYRIDALPVHRGYPVPWFVAWFDENKKETRPGVGEPDFRIIASGAIDRAHTLSRCWICGTKLGRYKTFVIGPMCAVNRVSSEPPSHTVCAMWSAEACPFLTRPHMRRREDRIPEGTKEAAGIMLPRNPGVVLVWTTTRYSLVRAPNGVLFDIGEPERVTWYAEGRAATRDEILESIHSGMPDLYKLAEADPLRIRGKSAVEVLEAQYRAAIELVPA